MTLRIFSNGGGVQSIAALALSAKAKAARAGDADAAAFLLDVTRHKFSLEYLLAVLDFPIHAFSNVGDDSEMPDTLRYVREVATPYAEQHGIELVMLERRPTRGIYAGRAETLHGRLTRDGSKSMPIPMRGHDTGAPGTRSCTADFKIRVLSRFAKERGATKDNPAIVGLGISLDEWDRMKTDSGEPVQVLSYPLIDLRLSRDQCAALIAHAGLPVPPKSSCWFCPFHRPSVWMRLRVEEPELFEKAANLEALMNARRPDKPPVWLTRFGKSLREAIGEQSMMSFDDEYSDACESGYCMT